MKKTIYSLIAFAAVLSSCSSEPTTIKEGESFAFSGQNITVNITSASVLSNDDLRSTIIAPTGKLYLKVDVKAEEDSYFLTVKDGEQEVEEVDYLIAKNFLDKSDDMMDPNKHKLYLVDASNANYSIEIKSYGDDLATLSVGQLQDNSTVSMNSTMTDFVGSFKEGARLSEVVQKFVPEGTVAYDYLSETGMEMTSDPIVKGLEIRYVIDQDTYECSSEFGIDEMTVTWSGNNIKSVVFE